MLKIKYIHFIIPVFLVWSCTETREVNPGETGMDYFPLQPGNYVIYQVEGVEYTNPIDSTVFSYQLKESIEEAFVDLEAGTSYKILREVRGDENQSWETDSVWTARKDEIRVVKTENNVPYVRLVFPLKENKTWDGNGFNASDPKEYEMVDVRKPFTLDDSYFDLTVTVIEDYFPKNNTNYIFRKKIYSKDIGLVYEENINLNYLQGSSCEFCGLDSIKDGVRYFQSIISYGQD